MESLLSKVKPSDVIPEPFPHIVIKDALEEEDYAKLVLQWPSITTLSQGADNKMGRDLSSNKRFHYLANESLSNTEIAPIWKEFIFLHTSTTFLQKLLHIFQEHILQLYPEFEQEYGTFETLSAGLRRVDTLEDVDVLLDALICINTPAIAKPTAVRRAHIDLPDKLFAGLFYMRDPQDKSTGGDLELYKFKKGDPYGFINCERPDRYIEYVKTIKYERNVFVLFINSLYSLHGVSVRSLTDHYRYFVNLVGEVKKPLFNPYKYQEKTSMKYARKLETAMRKVTLAVK